MDIIFLITQDLASPSGLGRYWPMAKELSRLGHKVHIYALHSNFAKLGKRNYIENGVEISYIGPMHVLKEGNKKTYYPWPVLLWISLGAVFKFISVIFHDPSKYILICKPHPMNSIAGYIAKLFFHRTIILDCDDYEAGSTRFSGIWQRYVVQSFEQWTPRWADFVTTNTRFTQQRLIDTGVLPEKIIYIPNGIDRERFENPDLSRKPELLKEIEIENKPVIIYIGTLSLISHPVDLLIKAFSIVRQRIPDVQLVLVGGGEDLDTLKHLGDELEISDSVHFCGRIPSGDIPLYYSIAQVSVDPVNDDPVAKGRSPLKLFESWACGVPFVTADVGDRRILSGNGYSAILVKPGDPGLLASDITNILNAPKLQHQLAIAGVSSIKEYYWDRLILGLNERINSLSNSSDLP